MSKKSKNIINYIDNNVKITGDMSFEGSIRVGGTIIGTIKSTGTLILDDESSIIGDIYVENLIIYGTVKGNICAIDTVDIHKTAKIYGNLNYSSLEIEAGAVHEGISHQLKEEEKENLIASFSKEKENELVKEYDKRIFEKEEQTFES